MQAQMFMMAQGVDDRIRNAAHTNLQGGPVGYLGGHIVTYLGLYLIRHGCRHFHQWHIAATHSRNLADVYQWIAVEMGHILVDLSNDHLRALGTRESDIG